MEDIQEILDKGDKAEWNEILKVIDVIKRNYPKRKPVFEMIEKYPLTIKSIDFLVEMGWSVELWRDSKGGLCNISYRYIGLGNNLQGYERDKILFHELSHAWYTEVLYPYHGRVFYPRNRDIKFEVEFGIFDGPGGMSDKSYQEN